MMSSTEMCTMTMAMPAMPQGPVELRLRCIEVTPANVAVLRKLRTAAAESGLAMSSDAVLQSGLKGTEMTARLSTTVAEIRKAIQGNLAMEDAQLTLYAVSRTTASDSEDPLVSLFDELTLETVLECPQLVSVGTGAPAEVRVGDARESGDASLVLFYARDTKLGCADCCLWTCCAAACATVLCCCCSD